MVGKRLLQIIVHTTIIVACASGIPGLFRYQFDHSEILMAVAVIICLIPFAVSVKLNWVLLKRSKLLIKLPRTSALHFVALPLSGMIVYFASTWRFHYDDHLSSYWLFAEVTEWRWLPGQIMPYELGVVAGEVGMYMFVFYVFTAMLIFTMHTLGLFSQPTPDECGPIGRTLLSFQIATSVLLVLIVVVLLYNFSLSISAYAAQIKLYADLLNLANLGVYFFNAVNLVLLALYATWVLVDSIHLRRRSLGATNTRASAS